MIKESEPAVFRFSTDQPVSAGRPKKISIPIYRHIDLRNIGAPRYRNDGEKLEFTFESYPTLTVRRCRKVGHSHGRDTRH